MKRSKSFIISDFNTVVSQNFKVSSKSGLNEEKKEMRSEEKKNRKRGMEMDDR